MLRIRDEIARIPGVADFQIYGERQYAMRVWIDPDKAAAYDITANEILAAIPDTERAGLGGCAQQAAAVEPGGLPDQRRDTRPPDHAGGVREHHRQVGQPGPRHPHPRHRPRRVGSADYSSKAYADRYASAPWFVIATPDANVYQLHHAIWDKMAELKKKFPPGIDYNKIYDPTNFVDQSIEGVIHTIFEAVLLVVAVVFVFLQSWRATIIPVIAIPISLIGTFTLLALFGASINNLSMFGLVLAVGIVVDDAIVVVENVERNMAAGLSPREAAHKTMTEVSTALIAIALTLCAVFVPTAFISGISGLFFKQFAITIAASTVISCFVP